MAKPAVRSSLAALTAVIAMAVTACGERTIKSAGQECAATTECAAGLLCDFASEPPVCAGEGSGPQPMTDDAAVGGDDAAVPADAAPDAPVDAAIDAAAVDAAI